MLCQMCSKKEANFHYKSNENGKITEKHLCKECAKKSGYLSDETLDMFNPFGSIDNLIFENSNGLLGELFGNMLGNGKQTASLQKSVCTNCGMRQSDFINGARLGCSECYKVFSSLLEPTIKRIHGNVRHNGKFPSGRKEYVEKQRKIEGLKEKLEKAIQTQEYENAAKIRDQIRSLENDDNSEKESK